MKIDPEIINEVIHEHFKHNDKLQEGSSSQVNLAMEVKDVIENINLHPETARTVLMLAYEAYKTQQILDGNVDEDDC